MDPSTPKKNKKIKTRLIEQLVVNQFHIQRSKLDNFSIFILKV